MKRVQKSWKSDGPTFSGSNSLVTEALSIWNSESLAHTGPWVSPDTAGSNKSSLAILVLLSQEMSHIEATIRGTVDLNTTWDRDGVVLGHSLSDGVVALSVGYVKYFTNSRPWISENIISSSDRLDTALEQLFGPPSDVCGTISSS